MVLSIAELVVTIQEQAHQLLATIGVKCVRFLFHLWEADRDHLAFTWKDAIYFYMSSFRAIAICQARLTMHYRKNLHKLLTKEGIWVYDVWMIYCSGAQTEVVLQIPTESTTSIFRTKVFGHLMEGRNNVFPLNMMKNKKELLNAQGLLVFWRNHMRFFHHSLFLIWFNLQVPAGNEPPFTRRS